MNGRGLGGAVGFVAGATFWYFTRGRASEAGARPSPARSLPRIGLAGSALGLSVMASAQRGVSWSVSSICFSLVAIILLATVARDALRR
jgi:hypothetical protein